MVKKYRSFVRPGTGLFRKVSAGSSPSTPGAERDVYLIGGSLESEHLEKRNWEKHPWRWPNEKDAKAYGAQHIFEDGKAKLMIGNEALQKRMVPPLYPYFLACTHMTQRKGM